MPDTGERREITRRVNAKQAETVQQSKKLLSKTRQFSASMEARNIERIAEITKGRSRERGRTDTRWASSGRVAVAGDSESGDMVAVVTQRL